MSETEQASDAAFNALTECRHGGYPEEWGHIARQALDDAVSALSRAVGVEKGLRAEIGLQHAALRSAKVWIDKAKAPGDTGTDFLNEDGWDQLDDVSATVDAALAATDKDAAP